MKKIFLIFTILCLVLTAGCRPKQPEEQIDGNPAAGRQPVTIKPLDGEQSPDTNTDQTVDPSPSPNTPEKITAENLTNGLFKREMEFVTQDGFPAAAADFSLRLMTSTAKKGENTLLSPLSLMQTLGMVSLGAQNNTYVELEQTILGKNDLSLHQNLASVTCGDLKIANSVWIRNTFTGIKNNFLQDVFDYYGTDIFRTRFDDTTRNDINAWCKEKTEGLIPEILREAPSPKTQMYLINALMLDAAWSSPFVDGNISDGTFHAADGTKQSVKMMKSKERLYLENELATGFRKSYTNGCTFIALLPKNGTPDELIAALDGKAWKTLMQPIKNSEVSITLPQFTVDFEASLVEPLQTMGIRDAFDRQRADFSGISDADGLFITDVFQKTKLEVDKNGTRAAAVTALVGSGTHYPAIIQHHTVTLDRPFVYAIVDRQSLPIFIGTLHSVK